MSTARTQVNATAEKDSFLPKNLSVQLLAILAETINNNQFLTEQIKVTPQNSEFIASFKNKDLFTPITDSIFWRDNIDAAIQQNPTLLTTTDKHNRTPITLALANEDFALATALIKQGATLSLEDKLVLEIAITSMIQRDPTIINKILATQTTQDLSWIKEYLEYLHSYTIGEPKNTTKYHEVLNPPIRHFGQILDTLTFFNGLPSHYGFLSPSLSILTAHLELYVNDLGDKNHQELFKYIATAYKKSLDTCNFYGNLPTNPDAGNILLKQIIANASSTNKNIVVLFGGWAGNSVTIAFINKTLIFSNLGIGGSPDAGTKIFSINNPANITAEGINLFLRGLGTATSPLNILTWLSSFVEAKPIFMLKQPFNPIDNCIFVNPRAIIQGILLVLQAYQKDSQITATGLEKYADNSNIMYKKYLHSLYKYAIEDLAQFMRNNELLQNKRIECCAIAIDYINQHHKEPEAIERCIELKNALEYVGLKEVYARKVNQQAKEAIQNFMIHQQELAAIRVMEQESLLGKKEQ